MHPIETSYQRCLNIVLSGGGGRLPEVYAGARPRLELAANSARGAYCQRTRPEATSSVTKMCPPFCFPSEGKHHNSSTFQTLNPGRVHVATHTYTRTHTGGRPMKEGVRDKGELSSPPMSPLPAWPPATIWARAPPPHPSVPVWFWPWRAQGLARARPAGAAQGRAEASRGPSRRCGPTCRPIGGGAGRAQGGGGMMDGLSAGCGRSSGGPANVNRGWLRAALHCTVLHREPRKGCLHKRTRLGMFRLGRLVSITALWGKGKRTLGKRRARNPAQFRADV